LSSIDASQGAGLCKERPAVSRALGGGDRAPIVAIDGILIVAATNLARLHTLDPARATFLWTHDMVVRRRNAPAMRRT
jgi:hypothetical protein